MIKPQLGVYGTFLLSNTVFLILKNTNSSVRVINHLFVAVEVIHESGALRAKANVDLRESSGEGNEIYFQPLRHSLFWSLPPKNMFVFKANGYRWWEILS